MKNCESCGMPMVNQDDFGGGKPTNKYCKNCTDNFGNLKSRKEVKEGMIQFRMMSKGENKKEATKWVNKYMKKMPAWKR